MITKGILKCISGTKCSVTQEMKSRKCVISLSILLQLCTFILFFELVHYLITRICINAERHLTTHTSSQVILMYFIINAQQMREN